MNYYIADTHFNHANVIAFDNRPFKTVAEMNAALIQNWNSVVTPADHIYILGDFHWGKAKDWPETLKQLAGNKHLIRGNHDVKAPFQPELKQYFVEVTDYKEISDGEQHIVLCHFPMPAFKNMYYGWLHFYGHVHKTTEHNIIENTFWQMESYYEFPKRAFNVGCMMPYMNYTPRTMEEIVEGGAAYGRDERSGPEAETVPKKAAEEGEA